jgi:mannosyltransferase
MKKKFQKVYQRFADWRGSDWVLVIGALAMLAVLTIPTIAQASIWFDEAFSAYITRFSFYDIAKYTAVDVHPPLYYWALKAWEMIFGYSAVAIRSLSVLFAAVAAVFGYLLVRRLFGRRAAAVSLLLVVLEPMVIRYSREARMYTMAAAIVLAATYVLTFAINSKRKRPWIVYAILVAAGMWTHYFTALAWLAHWLWRFVVVRRTGARGKELRHKFFSKTWIWTHVLAIALFVAWVPFMAIQLGGIQGGGFWIGQVGIYTPINYVSNFFVYQEHDYVLGWLGIIVFVVATGAAVLAVRAYRSMNKSLRQNYLLLVIMALVPVILLILLSLPPLRPSYVERYVMPSLVSTSLLLGVTLVYGLKKARLRWRIGATIVVIGVFAIGIGNVYYYGNYNKNSDTLILTGNVIQEINAKAKPGEPIIASSPWIFYEAVFYSTPAHPVYFVDADTQYSYGSLEMLKDNDQHKIKDVPAFLEQHPIVWYIGNSNQPTVTSNRTTGWQPLQTISQYDAIDKNDNYKATEYETN